jgi:osmotically-inducible protein OsmY
LLRSNARFHQVQATVAGRIVTLSGAVARPADRDDLLHAVCALEGVEGVEHAKLRVSEP